MREIIKTHGAALALGGGPLVPILISGMSLFAVVGLITYIAASPATERHCAYLGETLICEDTAEQIEAHRREFGCDERPGACR